MLTHTACSFPESLNGIEGLRVHCQDSDRSQTQAEAQLWHLVRLSFILWVQSSLPPFQQNQVAWRRASRFLLSHFFSGRS